MTLVTSLVSFVDALQRGRSKYEESQEVDRNHAHVKNVLFPSITLE
jgi:hypothetical protein